MTLGIYRTKTYIAADFDSDRDAVNQLNSWNISNRWGLSFTDVHALTQSRDSSHYCSIKCSLRNRMNVSKVFILIVGANTNTITKGSCKHCSNYRTYFTLPSTCLKGNSINILSYIKYECSLAVKAGIRIVVLYKSTRVNRSLCPELVRNIGTHVAMKHSIVNAYGRYIVDWDYQTVKNAIVK